MKNMPTDGNKINLVEIPQEQLEKERNPNYEYFSIDEPKQEQERMYSEEDLREELFCALNIDRTTCCTTRTTDSIVREAIKSIKKLKNK